MLVTADIAYALTIQIYSAHSKFVVFLRFLEERNTSLNSLYGSVFETEAMCLLRGKN